MTQELCFKTEKSLSLLSLAMNGVRQTGGPLRNVLMGTMLSVTQQQLIEAAARSRARIHFATRGATALDRTSSTGCATRVQELKRNGRGGWGNGARPISMNRPHMLEDINQPTGRLTPDRPVGILYP